MPYHKKMKTDRPPRGQVPEIEMKAAVAAVLEGRTVYSVAKETGVNAMTLKRYVKKICVDPNTLCRPNYVTKQIFTNEEEKSFFGVPFACGKTSLWFINKCLQKVGI